MFDPSFEKAFGDEIDPRDSANEMARSVVALLLNEQFPYARLLAAYRDQHSDETVKFEVDVERPQRPAADIRSRELVAARFLGNSQPSVFALRSDFPTDIDILHLNLGIEGWPPWLCLDERPWPETRSRWTALRFIERIRWWLAATARGDLHAPDQPVEPLFVPDLGVIVPIDLLTDRWNEQRILDIHMVNNGTAPATLVLREGSPKNAPSDPFLPIVLDAKPQPMQRLRAAPTNIDQLDRLLDQWGIALVSILRERLIRLNEHEPARLSCRPLLVLRVPLLRPDGSATGEADVKAFSTRLPFDLAKLGIALGVFLDAGVSMPKGSPVARRISLATEMRGAAVPIVPLAVYGSYSRQAAELGSGLPADDRAMVLVGAGAIGSHFLEIVRRDGFGTWTVIDNDAFLPHNVQRHRLGAPLEGSSKASATADYVNWVAGAPSETNAICADVLRPDPAVQRAFNGASIIVDSSGSIAVARHLSDIPGRARRMSIFFNSPGRDVVLLSEDAERAITLDSLEAQYYRAVLEDSVLANHMAEPGDSYRYAASCRSVSFKMPEHQVSMLAGAVAGEFRRQMAAAEAGIAIWVGNPDAGLTRKSVTVTAVTRQTLSDWQVVLDESIIATLKQFRAAALPAETGGILLGTIDVARCQLCIVQVVPAPKDSHGSRAGFERGVKDLKAVIESAHRKTAGQVEYVGEWHSHPEGERPSPSTTDVRQLIWLGAERQVESLPAVMLILGDDGRYTISMAISARAPSLSEEDS